MLPFEARAELDSHALGKSACNLQLNPQPATIPEAVSSPEAYPPSLFHYKREVRVVGLGARAFPQEMHDLIL